MNNPGLLQRSTGAAMLLSGLVVVAALAVPVSALGQPLAGEASSGRQIATTICSSCHQLVGEKSGVGAPGFADIANMPSTTALSLRVFLRSSHREMPNLIISDAESDGLIAYILSLKKPAPEHR